MKSSKAFSRNKFIALLKQFKVLPINTPDGSKLYRRRQQSETNDGIDLFYNAGSPNPTHVEKLKLQF